MNNRQEHIPAVGVDDSHRLIHFIGAGTQLPASASPAALGFKAWNLARMAALGDRKSVV